jgi:CheY-like chemotaxis protein
MGKGRVLVVDDDASIRDMLDMALAGEGYEVVVAIDGAAALDAARRSPPDVVLLDVKMPNVDGAEFVRRYRAEPGAHAPIVLITATTAAAERAAELGTEGYLGKPFDLETLLEMISRVTSG